MTATQRNDGWLRTHDEVRAAITAEADRLGAKAYVERLGGDHYAATERKVERLGRYTVALERLGFAPLSQAAAYSLPAPEDKLIEHVRTMVEGAARAAETEMKR